MQDANKPPSLCLTKRQQGQLRQMSLLPVLTLHGGMWGQRGKLLKWQCIFGFFSDSHGQEGFALSGEAKKKVCPEVPGHTFPAQPSLRRIASALTPKARAAHSMALALPVPLAMSSNTSWMMRSQTITLPHLLSFSSLRRR